MVYVSPRNDFVIMNKGKKDGVGVGVPFSLYRKGEKVAEIRVIRVTDDAAACDIVARETIQAVQVWDEVQPRRTYGIEGNAQKTSHQ